ncbi:MAG: hypothetical protein HEP70_01620 [Rhodobiaceae bacterium]|nr:hypothetical protein [Rhodobiaceae bacterium]
MTKTSQEGFRRRFGEVYQYQWLYGDGSVDLVEHTSKFTEVGAALAVELGMEDLKIDEGGFRLFRPLISQGNDDSLVLLERYDDIRVWAAGEYEAQTSHSWMSAILADQDNPSTWLGEGCILADDALTPPKKLNSSRIAIDWTTFDPTKKAALVEFPSLIQELTELLDAAGFSDTAVRYFGMTTTAGAFLNHAHLWLEHESPSVMGEVLAWRQSAAELHDWRNRLTKVSGTVRSHQLLVQVA